LALAALVGATGCEVSTARGLLPIAGRSRLVTYGDHEEASVDFEMAVEVVDGEHIHLPVKFLFDVDGQTGPWVEWHPVGVKHDGSWRLSSSGELLAGVHQRISGPRSAQVGGFQTAFSAEAFAVFPHGGAKPARWPGVVENEEGYFVLGAGEIGNEQVTLALNLGAGVGGRPGRTGKSGRVLGGGALTYALQTTGIDYATEPSRVTLESFWTHDPIDDRTLAELSFGVSLWLGVVELDMGYRRGLTDGVPQDVFYIGIRSRAFDTFSF
jgi:hypothetical protein